MSISPESLKIFADLERDGYLVIQRVVFEHVDMAEAQLSAAELAYRPYPGDKTILQLLADGEMSLDTARLILDEHDLPPMFVPFSTFNFVNGQSMLARCVFIPLEGNARTINRLAELVAVAKFRGSYELALNFPVDEAEADRLAGQGDLFVKLDGKLVLPPLASIEEVVKHLTCGGDLLVPAAA